MKTKIYLAFFILLVLFAAYTLYSNQDISKQDKDFKVSEFEKVSTIIITDRASEVMELKRVGEKWILNNKFAVRPHLMDQVEEALTKMEAISPVPEVGKKAVVNQMITHALKVEIFKGSKKDKVIYIGGPNLKNTASHMFLEINGKSSDQIYNVSIPGFRGYLTTRFEIREDEWRDRELFSYLPNQVKSVAVKYFNRAPHKDFILKNEDNKFSLQIENESHTNKVLNNKNIVNYLKELEHQSIMRFDYTTPEQQAIKDSLLTIKKFAELVITDSNNEKTKVIVVDMPLGESTRKQYDENGDLMPFDSEFQYVEFGENRDWGVVRMDKFGLLLAPPELFLLKNKEQ